MFFFSSRRRHTRFKCDWSSDVCSSDLGVAAAEWLVKQDPMLVGGDTPPVEVNPNPDPQISLPVHQIMLVVNGIHILENLKLDELAAKKAYEFAFVIQPLKLRGFTGSAVAPSAIRYTC